jgi:hypothetical protein
LRPHACVDSVPRFALQSLRLLRLELHQRHFAYCASPLSGRLLCVGRCAADIDGRLLLPPVVRQVWRTWLLQCAREPRRAAGQHRILLAAVPESRRRAASQPLLRGPRSSAANAEPAPVVTLVRLALLAAIAVRRSPRKQQASAAAIPWERRQLPFRLRATQQSHRSSRIHFTNSTAARRWCACVGTAPYRRLSQSDRAWLMYIFVRYDTHSTALNVGLPDETTVAS